MELTEEQIWRLQPVDGFGGYYRVSNTGVVYSLHRGELRRLKGRDNGYGYLTVRLGGKEARIHSLVAAAFLGARPQAMMVNHKDGNKQNNRSSNLEYVDRSENGNHAYRLGLASKSSEDSPTAKIKRSDLPIIIQRRKSGETLSRIGKDYGVQPSAISKIVLGRTWQ